MTNSNDARAELGRRAETLAAQHFEALGFTVLGRNVRQGRYELDLIARRRNLIVFCEVRARAHDRFVAPAATIDPSKVRRLRAAAALWLRAQRPGSVDIRFDAVAVVFDTPEGRLEHYEGAF